MGITGDSIVIKENLKFYRVEDLKVGDKLLSLGNECIISSIDRYYSDKGYVIKTNNFFEFNVDINTKVLSSRINKVYDKTSNTNKLFLLDENFKNIQNINNSDLLPIKSIKEVSNDVIKELWIYAKLILKGEIYDDKIIFKNFSDKFNKYKIGTELRMDIRKNYTNNIVLEKKDLEWINFLSSQIHKRILSEKLFNLNKDDFLIFIESFLKENTEMYINNNQFRVYCPSKIMTVQLMYLILKYFKKSPTVELIKKELWSYKKVKQSNKRNKFSITCHPEYKKILYKKDFFWQEIDYIKENNRNLPYFKIETINNEPLFLYNIIIKN